MSVFFRLSAMVAKYFSRMIVFSRCPFFFSLSAMQKLLLTPIMRIKGRENFGYWGFGDGYANVGVALFHFNGFCKFTFFLSKINRNWLIFRKFLLTFLRLSDRFHSYSPKILQQYPNLPLPL